MDDNPQNVTALDIDNYKHYVLTPKPVLGASSMLHEPKQFVQFAISLTIFTAQEAGIYSNVELTNFWNRVLFRKKLRYYTEVFEKNHLV